MPSYETIKALRDGEAVEIEGCMFVKAEGDLAPGDWYIAERNGGPKLLTVHHVEEDGGYVVPQEPRYCYDLHECVKVMEVEGSEASGIS
jgi:hypothetical protein